MLRKITLHCTFRFSGILILAVSSVLSGALFAQKYTLTYDTDSPPGQHLELIELADDKVKRIPLMEQFAERYPTHAAIGWIYENLMDVYWNSGQFDKLLAAGEKLLAIHSTDLHAAQLCLKAAEAKKDAALIKTWTELTRRVAADLAKQPAPKESADEAEWNHATQVVKYMGAQSEYDLFQKALRAPDLRTRLKHIADLRALNARSTYMHNALLLAFQAYKALGETSRAVEVAEKIVQYDPNNEDSLLAIADAYLRSKSPLALPYASKVAQLMQTKRKPAELSVEQWSRKQRIYQRNAYWIIGNVHYAEKRFAEAEAAFQVALPLVEDEDSKETIHFFLGWSNYKLQNYHAAVKYLTLCAARPGPYQQQALQNIEAIRKEGRLD